MKVGIDIGGSHIAIGVIDDNGKILVKDERRILTEEKVNAKEIIKDYIVKNVKEFNKKYEIESIGMAVPGTVSESVIIKSVNLNIENFNIVEELNKKIDLSMHIRNDAKCAALAEHKYGCIRSSKNALFLTLGTGIGGAVIYNNNLLEAKGVPGFELGHMIIERNGKQCKCGNKGCFETYSSMKVLKNNLRRAIGKDETTRGEELLQMLREKGDKEPFKTVVDTYIEYLAIGISNLINIFEPETIGIGGSFVYFEDVLLERLKQKILELDLLFNKRAEIKIYPAVLGNDAGIIGSVL